MVLEQSIAHVFPSCSEAGAAVVLETMAAGVIPVVSYESSIDVENFGFLLGDVSIETIMRQAREIVGMSVDELRRRAKKAWEAAHNNHTPEKFEQAYRATVEMILAKHGRR